MIYPPRPEEVIPRDLDIRWLHDWILQIKYNDTRVVITYDNNHITIYNRHKEQLKKHKPSQGLIDDLNALRKTLDITGPTILDGGLLDDNTLAIWDILKHNNKSLIGTTYAERATRLRAISSEESREDMGHKISDHIWTPHNWNWNERDQIWDIVARTNQTQNRVVLEGIVYKNPEGILEPGYKEKNNTTWLIKSRIQTGRHRF